MIIAITGTPGVGKTSISNKLANKGYTVLDLNKIAYENDFLYGKDEQRKSNIVNIVKLNRYIQKKISKDKLVFVDGHLSHLLKSVDFTILLRLHPSYLKKHLEKKGWGKEKIKENLEAEMLDVILCEAAEVHSKESIVEINATGKSIDEIVSIILDLIKNGFKNMQKYKIGNIDWSEEILKDF